MKKWMLFICCALIPATAFALKSGRSVDELKANFKNAKTAQDRFYAESALVKAYASEKLMANNSAEAESYADALLKAAEHYKSDSEYANAVHHAHLVLGRVMLLSGDIEMANEELLLAAKVPGSPQLQSAGPNMTLAKEILAVGEKRVVLKYFDACLKFWKDQHAEEKVKSWRAVISQGGIPDFKANLIF